MKQKCLRRICLESEITGNKRKMLKMLERELEVSIQNKLDKKKGVEPGAVLTEMNNVETKQNKEESLLIEKIEKKGKSPGIKLKIKLKPSNSHFNTHDDKWASEIIFPEDDGKIVSPNKRRNEEDSESNENRKKIKTHDFVQTCSSEDLQIVIKSEIEDVLEMQNNDENVRMQNGLEMQNNVEMKNMIEMKKHAEPKISGKPPASSAEVDRLIKSEVQEILEMQRSFSEDLKNLIRINGDDSLDFEDEEVGMLPPKTPKKNLDSTIEKLKNRIGTDSQSALEKDDLDEEQVLDMLLNESKKSEMLNTSAPRSSEKLLDESVSSSRTTLQEMSIPQSAEEGGTLGFGVGDISKSEDTTFITLFPNAALDVPSLNPEVEKFEKLKLISTKLVSGELSLGDASTFTGLGLPVVRCWLEALQQVVGGL